MNDPHVERLRYRIVCGPSVDYDKAPPLEHKDEPDFDVRVADGQVVVEMKTHYATEQGARAVVEPFMRAWEVAADLQHDPGDLRFKFDRADVVDRAPTPGVITFRGAVVATATMNATLHLGRSRYPSPFPGFVLSVEAQQMAGLYRAVRMGGERPSVVAYQCLTILDGSSGARRGRRRRAAEKYRIDYEVLRKVGKLTGENVGGPGECRKGLGGTPYTEPQKTWLGAVVKAFIRRAGEYAANPGGALPQITMADLPPLP